MGRRYEISGFKHAYRVSWCVSRAASGDPALAISSEDTSNPIRLRVSESGQRSKPSHEPESKWLS